MDYTDVIIMLGASITIGLSVALLQIRALRKRGHIQKKTRSSEKFGTFRDNFKKLVTLRPNQNNVREPNGRQHVGVGFKKVA